MQRDAAIGVSPTTIHYALHLQVQVPRDCGWPNILLHPTPHRSNAVTQVAVFDVHGNELEVHSSNATLATGPNADQLCALLGEAACGYYGHCRRYQYLFTVFFIHLLLACTVSHPDNLEGNASEMQRGSKGVGREFVNLICHFGAEKVEAHCRLCAYIKEV